MKLRLIIGFILTGTMVISAGAQENSGAQSIDGLTASLPQPPSGSTDTPPAQLQLPSGLGNTQQYPQRMELVLQALSEELGVIAQAAREEKIRHAQAEYLSVERYYVALTRFEFLRTLYQESPQSNQRDYNSQPDTAPQTSGDTVIIPPQTSSPDVSAQIVSYLNLNPAQIAAMQAQISEDRKQVQPLLDRLEESRRKLIAIKLNGKFDTDKVKTLAAEQSQIIKQLIVANALLETKLYRMLSSEQQEKLDQLRRQTLASAKASFPEW
jgi:Spy/CpxP family protein refolding chaperone